MLTGKESPVTYKAGEEVEVRFEDEGFETAWYEARVVSRIPKRRRYSVVYNSLADEADVSRPLVEAVTCSQMRPRPPRLRSSGGCRIGLHQWVDAFYLDGWWAGVVSKAPKNRRTGKYTVRFPDTWEEMKFGPTQLRPHIDWVDREWVRVPTLEEKTIKSPKLGGARTENHGQPSANIARKPKGQSEGVCCPMGDGQQSKLLVYQDQFRQCEVLHGGDVGECTTGKKRKKSITRKVTIIDKKASSEENEQQQLDGIDDARIGREDIMEEVDKSVIDDDSSISHEIQLLCHGNKETNHADALCTVNHEGDSVGDPQDNTLIGEPSVEGHSTSQTEAVTPGEACIKGVQVQALSEMMVGSFSSILLGTSISQHEARSEAQNESLLSTSRVPIVGALTGPMSGKLPSEKSYLPFQRRSSIWEFIESTDVISKISQPPHFRPLEQYCEDLREGMAIGLTVTFSSLVNSMNDLKIDDSLDKFDEKMKTLMHLEEHGFDVQYARARLEELLRIKSNHVQVVEKISALKVVISGKANDRDRLNAEIEATEKAAMVLQQTLAHLYEKKTSLFRKKEENDTDIVKLQMDGRVVEEMFQSVEHDFEGVKASRSWSYEGMIQHEHRVRVN